MLFRSQAPLATFMADRLAYLLEQRGFDVRSVRAVMAAGVEQTSPLEARLKLEALAKMSGSPALQSVGRLLKRAKNITKDVPFFTARIVVEPLKDPAEQALANAIETQRPGIRDAVKRADFMSAFTTISSWQPTVEKFFDDVLEIGRAHV